MSTLMLSQMGLSMVNTFGSFASANIEAGLNARIQAYQNTMSNLSAARSKNAVTVNEVRVQDAATQADQSIQKQSMRDQALAEVDAAASGVKGNSIKLAIRDLKASASSASYAVQRNKDRQLSQFREQKTSIDISAITGQNVQVIPKPSVGSLLLGVGTNLLSIYDSHQPEGSRLFGPNGGRVDDSNLLQEQNMSQGLERRAGPTDNLKGQDTVNPVTRSVPSVGSAPAPRPTPDNFSAQVAKSVSKFTSGKLAEIQRERQEKSMIDGQIAGMQGQSFESVEMEGDKWALEGWRVVSAQSMSASLLRAQEQEIASGAYEQDPDAYRAKLVSRIDSMTSEIPDERTRTLARESLMEQMPTLIDTHMKQNLSFKEQQNFDTLAQSVDVLSRDNSNTGALIDFATGVSEATSGLSQERRRTAVVQGVVNSFTNNNPAAYAHLEEAGFFNTENLTASQLQKVRSAQSAYETRLRQQWNGQLEEEMTSLEDRVSSGELNPLVAAEEQARIMAAYGLKMRASEGSQIYKRARAGVEFAEGTRGLNIEAAGASGDYALQAELLQDAVIHQESRGNHNAVSPVGATGIMQLMPGTAMSPGFGVRNIFTVARSLGVPVSGETEQVAQELMRNEQVNKTMGTEYLSTMLERYNGDVSRALVAYNWGPGNADNWNGNPASLPKETQGYLKNILGSVNDDIPDPRAERVEAEHRLNQVRETAKLATLEAMGPAMAQNDELFTRGEIPLEEWRANRQEVYSTWGAELDGQRLNQEQQMMRKVAGDRIAALQDTQDVQQAVQLETSLAAAEVQLQARQEAFAAGDTSMSLEGINEEYMQSVVGAYETSGAELDAGRISKDAADLVRTSSGLVARALKAQEEAAIISNAETSGTVGTLPTELRDRALGGFRQQLNSTIQNYRAENPDASIAELSAVERAAEIEYLSTNGIVDEALQQQINLAASGRWVDQQGNARPSTVVGLHSFVSMMSENPSLAYQYVPDPVARGRMLAASHMVMSMFPEREVFTDVDLSNQSDPVANAFYDTVQQVGLNVGNMPTEEETSERVNSAVKYMQRGNLTGSFLGGFAKSRTATALVPDSAIIAGMSGKFDMADVEAARSVDNDAIDRQFETQVTDFLENVVPHMPQTSQEGAVKMALNYVRDRGSVIGSSFVMPSENEPSISAQMFPGQQVDNTAAVNTAVTNWLIDPERNDPLFADWQEQQSTFRELARSVSPFHSPNAGTATSPEFTVYKVNGQYVANVTGIGSLVLPLKEIGDRYIANR